MEMNSAELQNLFSTNLKNARNRANLSQMKLAEKADLSVGYICDLESGRRWGTPETFSKLSLALGINPFELLLPSVQESASVSSLTELRDYIAKISDSLKQNVNFAVNKAISETLEIQLLKNE